MTKTCHIEKDFDVNKSFETLRKMYDHYIYLRLTDKNVQTLSEAINLLEIYEEEIKLMRRNMEIKYNRWVMDNYTSVEKKNMAA